ncbi:hypothetical protein WJT74_08100 [Sphingomicrobium sp. XHP0239]
MDRLRLFRSGFAAGWRSVTPAERERIASTGFLIGLALAVVAIVFIRSN